MGCLADEVAKSDHPDSEENARLANEQFMDGMTQMPEDDDLNDTMTRIAAGDIP